MQFSKTALTRLAGRTLARLIRHVGKTSQTTFDPPDLEARLAQAHPCIVACWHGQFMMLAQLRPLGDKVSAMVARHGDAELIGEAMRAFDVELIRGAGAGDRKKDRGGAAALRGSVRALKDGASLVMTADVPPGPARIAGIGIVTIAQLSGRPIVPVSAATSRFKSFDTWSRMTLNLPYSELTFVMGEPIRVPREASEADLEILRKKLEDELNATMVRAYAMAHADIAGATPLDRLAASDPPAPGLTLRIYKTALSALRPAAPALLKYRERRGKEDAARRHERLGKPRLARPSGPLIWVHAASVGETNVALPVIAEIVARDPAVNVLLTTGTTTSAALAAQRIPQRTLHQFVPLDAAEYAATFLDHWKPDLAIFTESEIWPNLILAASSRKIPLTLINARMSPRSMRRWRRSARLARPLFSRFALVLAQNERVARVIRFLGAPQVLSAGNLKVDMPPPPVDATALNQLKGATANRPILLAASTHPGEEDIVAAAHERLRASHDGLLTIIVPRHPDRGAELQKQIEARGLSVELRTANAVPSKSADIYIADTIGELGTFYSLAQVAFIGGSLIPHGGQNPIEPAQCGSAILTGPYTHNFEDAYATFEACGGAMRVSNTEDLVRNAGLLLSSAAERDKVRRGATEALSRLGGALATTLAALTPFLQQLKRS